MVKKKGKENVVVVEGNLVGNGNSSRTAKNRRKRLRRKQKINALSTNNAQAARAENASLPSGNGNVRNYLNKVKRENPAALDSLTISGMEWLDVATNPCAYRECSGYPDILTAPVLTPHDREYFDIAHNMAPEGSVVTGTISGGVDWNLAIIHDPTVLGHWVMIYQGSVTAPSYSCTFYRKSTMKDAVDDPTITSSRITAYGTTMEFTGPSINNQGRMILCQTKSAWEESKVEISTTDRKSSYFTWAFGSGSSTPQDLQDTFQNMMEVDPTSYAAEAKHGHYAPHKMNNSTILMRQHHQIGVNASDRICVNPFWTMNNPLPADLTTIPEGMVVRLSCDDFYNFNAVMANYTGMDVAATFMVKAYTYMEMQIAPKSNFRFYTRRSPDYEPEAEKLYNLVSTRMPSAFPSSYNAFGFLKNLWGGIKKGIKGVTGILKPFKPLIGAIPGIGEGINKGIEFAEGIAGINNSKFHGYPMDGRRARSIIV